ncbi:hypothetical protein EDB81DRAFT_759282 [Dactylonectria macrodidyma]|uniref:Uncharacterized protein n=1 Tax=Dactylonectria macrodidyma TaxID=307937 RepID=A0A9P9F0I0_9HYPO|nr:hypothetical protein EDB81DRAFT_759282 [Dactylonectria macrodidyma]
MAMAMQGNARGDETTSLIRDNGSRAAGESDPEPELLSLGWSVERGAGAWRRRVKSRRGEERMSGTRCTNEGGRAQCYLGPSTLQYLGQTGQQAQRAIGWNPTWSWDFPQRAGISHMELGFRPRWAEGWVDSPSAGPKGNRRRARGFFFSMLGARWALDGSNMELHEVTGSLLRKFAVCKTGHAIISVALWHKTDPVADGCVEAVHGGAARRDVAASKSGNVNGLSHGGRERRERRAGKAGAFVIGGRGSHHAVVACHGSSQALNGLPMVSANGFQLDSVGWQDVAFVDRTTLNESHLETGTISIHPTQALYMRYA